MSTLNRLPAASNPPRQADGTFTLYKDSNWGSQSMTIVTTDHLQADRHSIVGTALQDQANWVAYNLPVGCVVTLTENFTATPSNPADLAGAGRCVDLVGTGRTEGVDLVALKMKDCVSGYFWRDDVHLAQGAVVLYEDSGFLGNRTVLFLSDWERDHTFSLQGWYLHDKASSISWDGMGDVAHMTFYDHSDGTGVSYSDVKGWGSTKEIAHLKEVGVNDALSSFRWSGLIPKKEAIEPFSLDASSQVDLTSVSQDSHSDNSSELVQKATMKFLQDDRRTFTVTSTETHSAGGSLEFSHGFGVDTGISESKSRITVSVHYDYTHTQTTESSNSTEMTLGYEQEVNVPPKSRMTATLTAQVAQYPETTCSTTATRWYDQPVTGGVRDPAWSNWWRREEKVTFVVAGGLRLQTDVSFRTEPLL